LSESQLRYTSTWPSEVISLATAEVSPDGNHFYLDVGVIVKALGLDGPEVMVNWHLTKRYEVNVMKIQKAFDSAMRWLSWNRTVEDIRGTVELRDLDSVSKGLRECLGKN